MNQFSELSYYLKRARTSATVGVTDKVALCSILNRLDNIESFVNYLRTTEGVSNAHT